MVQKGMLLAMLLGGLMLAYILPPRKKNDERDQIAEWAEDPGGPLLQELYAAHLQ